MVEVLNALKNINDLKALGQDGFNVAFFKKCWSVVGKDVTNNALVKKCWSVVGKNINVLFHRENILALNCTSFTLIPKLDNPTNIREHRPISCCSTHVNSFPK